MNNGPIEITVDDDAGYPPIPPAGPHMEKHFTLQEIAKNWGVSANFCRRLFEKEDGVLVFVAPAKRYRRQHRTVRVPASVVQRVHRQLSSRAA